MPGAVARRPEIYKTVTPEPVSLNHLNLLKITATMRSTNTVMMEIVITRFVAILRKAKSVSQPYPPQAGRGKEALPTCHPPQRLDTPVHEALALEQPVMGMLDGLALSMQIGEGARADGLGLGGEGLGGLEALGGAIEAVGSRKQLLALLELEVVRATARAGRVVGVAGPEEGGAVVGQGAELALVGVDIGFVVSEALVYFGPRRGGNVLLFEAHLPELGWSVNISFEWVREIGDWNQGRGGGRTSSSASSRARSAWLIAALRGSPESSGI
jgi:hypothetical protein